ncbi:hypothetical protein EDC01DRAFT_677639 [Geopyxis carbonaria]|nr:hypothetical protein EDC01DRAFT_677639 [Geopyxis carbonaria]
MVSSVLGRRCGGKCSGPSNETLWLWGSMYQRGLSGRLAGSMGIAAGLFWALLGGLRLRLRLSLGWRWVCVGLALGWRFVSLGGFR